MFITSLKQLVLILIVCLIIGIALGWVLKSITANKANSVSKADITEAYSKGWVCWFSGYGISGSGVSAEYMDQYVYGRKYGNSFDSLYDAFETDYKDGCYHVNHHDFDPDCTSQEK